MEKEQVLTLDYSLTTSEERVECVKEVLADASQEELTNKYLTHMADYILLIAERNQTKKERKMEHPIVTKNREITIDKRQVSFEEITAHLENGEDGIYALMAEHDNQIMDHKCPISKKDIEEIPELELYLQTLESLKKQFAIAEGQCRYSLKRQIIETYQQMYLIKASHTGSPAKGSASPRIRSLAHMDLSENITLDEQGCPQSDGLITLFNPIHVSFLLTYYIQLKAESYEDLRGDMKWVLLELRDYASKALKDKPVIQDLCSMKVYGYSNEEIQETMDKNWGDHHSNQYYSTIWRHHIPKLIVAEAQKHYLTWYYTHKEPGRWKVCGRCGKAKLAHPLFFSKNNSKDSYYSICKECRNKKI